MNYFVKFLPEQYNLASGYQGMQITNLRKCRELEGTLNDYSEGKIVRAILPHSDISKPVELVPGYYFGGPGITVFGSVTVALDYNCNVYCMSCLDEKEIDLQFAKQFEKNDIDSFFYWDEDAAQKLMIHIAQELQKAYTISDFDESSKSLIEEHGGITKLEMIFGRGDIQYQKFPEKPTKKREEEYVVNEKTGLKYVKLPSPEDAASGHGYLNEASQETFIQSLCRRPFVKDKAKFEANKEHRMIFFPSIRDQNNGLILLSVNMNVKFIPAPTDIIFHH